MGYDFVTSLRNKRYINIELVLLGYQSSLSDVGSCEVDGVLWTWKVIQTLAGNSEDTLISYLDVDEKAYPTKK